MSEDRMLVTFKELQSLGWPYSRVHTWRMVREGRFPKPKKFGTHPGSRVAWYWKEVRPFFEPPEPPPSSANAAVA